MPAFAAVAPFVPALIAGGLSVVGGVLAGNASKEAAKIQAGAATTGQASIDKRFEQTRTDLAPFRDTGEKAAGGLADLYGFGGKGAAFSKEALSGFLSSPEYTTGLDAGIRARDRSAAAKGILQSPAQLEAQYKFGSDYTTNAIGGYIGHLMQLAGMGQSAAAQTGSLGASAAAQSASLGQEAGSAKAAGVVGAGNAMQSTISDLSTLALRSPTPAPSSGYSTFPASSYSGQDTNTLTGVY